MQVTKENFEKKNQRMVIKEGNKQLLLIGLDGEVFAIDNRCPHEGYPLSEGTSDSEDCVLTCNWHNWKFDLKSGKCLIGGDNVRTYSVEDKGDHFHIDTSDPTPEELEALILEGLKVAFDKRQFGRISREVARLHFNGLDPLVAVKKAILWSHDKFEFGMSHAYAALADWMTLYYQFDEQEKLEDKLICLTETIDHIAFDSLRHQAYPYKKESVEYSDELLFEAIEKEEREEAERLVFSRLQGKESLTVLEEVLSRAALEHYNDFGHSLIYVEKALEVSRHLTDPEVDLALGLCLVRSLCYSTREDLIPEFKNYAYTVAKLKKLTKDPIGGKAGPSLPRCTVNKSYEWLIENYPNYSNNDLYQEILKGNAHHFLTYDLSFQSATNNPVTKNVGWLSFTHAITFSNAVRRTCAKYPELWPQGLAQMICFYGRNTSYTMKELPEGFYDKWEVSDVEQFKSEVIETFCDHGLAGPIFSAHIIKTGVAIFEEADHARSEVKDLLFSSLNRFLHSPLKQKHVRRIVSQGIKLVAQDFK